MKMRMNSKLYLMNENLLVVNAEIFCPFASSLKEMFLKDSFKSNGRR